MHLDGVRDVKFVDAPNEVLILVFAPNPPKLQLLECEKALIKRISAATGWSLVTLEEAFVARIGESKLLDTVEAIWRLQGLDALYTWGRGVEAQAMSDTPEKP